MKELVGKLVKVWVNVGADKPFVYNGELIEATDDFIRIDDIEKGIMKFETKWILPPGATELTRIDLIRLADKSDVALFQLKKQQFGDDIRAAYDKIRKKFRGK